MNHKQQAWLPMVLCCIPALAIAGGLLFGIGSGLVLPSWIVVLACPVSMGAMMWMMSRTQATGDSYLANSDRTPTERLAALHQQRQALDAEIAATPYALETQSTQGLSAQTSVPAQS